MLTKPGFRVDAASHWSQKNFIAGPLAHRSQPVLKIVKFCFAMQFLTLMKITPHSVRELAVDRN